MSVRHRGLCWAEKNYIDEKGRRMKERAEDLYFGCVKVQLQDTNYGQYFGIAHDKLGAVYKQLKRDEYFDCLGLAEYDEGVKALADGRTLMFNAFGRNEIVDVTYNDPHPLPSRAAVGSSRCLVRRQVVVCLHYHG